MSGSSWEGKDVVEEFLKGQNIGTILDIGPGRGRYGLMARWVGIPKVHAIEIFEPYSDTYNYKYIYDTVIYGDVRKVEWPAADCIIFGDVLEHMPKPDAIGVFEKAKLKYPHVVLSIPIIVLKQGPSEGNVHETHISFWTFDELSKGICKDFPIQRSYSITGLFIR